ncbi:MAG: extracellular solute-binding protein [Bacillota bacterium]
MYRKVTAFILALSLLVLAGCGSKPAEAPKPAENTPKQAEPAKEPEKVTITFWHTYSADGSENKTMNEVVIPAFQKKYPHITVKAVIQPYDGLHDSLVTAAAGGTTPDVMRMDIIWTPEFAKLGALEMLETYPGFNELKAKVFPGPLATNIYKGKYYGLPLDTNTQVFVYNPEFLSAAGLSAPPKTWDEFKKYLSAFKGQQDKFGYAPGGTGPWAMLPLFWSLGGNVTNEDYTKASGYLNSADSVAALEELNRLLQEGLFATTLIGGQPGTWDGYKGGNYGALLEGPWFFAILGNELKGKMVGAPVPAGKGGSISVVGGENIVMFKSAKHKEAAWQFIQFLLSDEAQVAMARTGQMPVTHSASANPVMKEAGYYDAYVEQLKTAKPRTPVPAWNKIDKILNDAFESVFRSKATAKEALDKAAKEIDALLGQ